MGRGRTVAAASAAGAFLFASVGVAVSAAHAEDLCPDPPCFVSEGDKFKGAGSGSSEGSNGNGGGAPAAPVVSRPLPPTYIDYIHVPTCTGNSAYDAGVLCNAAILTCPEGGVRFWVYEQVIVRATGQPAGAPTFVDVRCIRPDAPELDPAVVIPARVQQEFKEVVVLEGSAQVSPAPETLVNVPTRFQTDAPASYQIPLTMLGQSVVITATAQRYTWHVGDGSTVTSTQPKGFAEYTYRNAATRQAYVVIEWSGTFSINGGAAQAINGTAVTTGDPTAVRVQQARSELVRN